ncbi:glycosyltransferase family A protein [Salinibacter ruber]|uniref:glycosyltransferase family A protein n=1 Tax=Salinibacter ruber TaxID=146919 RepID=UPI0020747B1D|nr:glycosyltransferase family A protein [Salinibacter ruber]
MYTTIHPGTRPFLEEWYESVRAQTDSQFDLWIGIDDLDVDEACAEMEARPEATWIRAEPEDTPAQVRERAWRALIPQADAVVMVDADDMMHPCRVEHARQQISECDIGACALQLVDEEGEEIDCVMPPSGCETPEDVLPRHNIFGLSNTVYRTQVLDGSLPVPKDITLIDWYLATQAWLKGSNLSVERAVLMKYRQHDDSTLSLLPPFTKEDVRRTTQAVQHHFSAVERNLPAGPKANRLTAFQNACEEVHQFQERILAGDERLEKYISALNRCPPLPLWWGCVARPELSHLWNNQTTQ